MFGSTHVCVTDKSGSFGVNSLCCLSLKPSTEESNLYESLDCDKDKRDLNQLAKPEKLALTEPTAGWVDKG